MAGKKKGFMVKGTSHESKKEHHGGKKRRGRKGRRK